MNPIERIMKDLYAQMADMNDHDKVIFLKPYAYSECINWVRENQMDNLFADGLHEFGTALHIKGPKHMVYIREKND